ncbi:hypothetical protein Bca52824_096024 [Brassica carinata]|uniref:Uncharacterized protein n=1 Tax=Brassica carinata TaxID=52824 RepID=A0A8X7P1D3_BRACI|nr:hypothetical protein Bca52824_096024 [Brassica carinata]
MSKLPGYLQGEKESNVVLNVGVLDWGRLEKWKHCRADTSGKCERKVSSTTTTLGTVPNATHRRCKIDDDDHHQVHASCSNLGKKLKLPDLQHGVGCTLEPELASSSRESSLNKQEMPTCSYKLSARDHERVRSRRSRSSSGLLSTMGNSGGSLKGRSFVVRDKETEKRAGEVYAQEARERGKQCVDKFDGEEKSVGGSNACEQQEVSNIVLLRSRRKQSRNTTLSSEMPSSSLDDNAKLVAREVNRSLDFERDSSEDIMLPPLLGVDLSAKTEPAGTRTRSRSRIFDQEKKRSFFAKQALPSYPEEKKNLQCGSRVSHLRRLLDPLLKPKGSENVLQDEKKKHQKKKSGSWLIQHGHKDKQQQQHRFVYNVVGEMRLCNYSTEQKSENRTSVIRESVLVDESEGVKGRKEVAAVVIKKKKPAEEKRGNNHSDHSRWRSQYPGERSTDTVD